MLSSITVKPQLEQVQLPYTKEYALLSISYTQMDALSSWKKRRW